MQSLTVMRHCNFTLVVQFFIKMSVETVHRAEPVLSMGKDDIPFEERWNRMKPVIQKLLSLETVPR